MVENLLIDLLELLPPETPENLKALNRQMGAAALELARNELDAADEDLDPLLWWPQHPRLAGLFPLAKMLFAIPAATAEDERSFSSAGFTLDQRRTRLELDNFRREHRIRQFLLHSGVTRGRTREGIQDRCHNLLQKYANRLQQVAAVAER